jgi:hypothetical protein
MEVGGQRHAPSALPPGKRPGTHCIGGWVGPRARLDLPALSKSLYRLSNSGPKHEVKSNRNIKNETTAFLCAFTTCILMEICLVQEPATSVCYTRSVQKETELFK